MFNNLMDKLKTEVGTALEEIYLLFFLSTTKGKCDRPPLDTQFELENSLWSLSRIQFSHVE